ncbi:hypothetical protein GF345_02250 [Candidatus Woesearchaeota archaeon]|nr:hypothetical protein [Candidatus Woesearchaeota archaeon]
MNKEHDSKRGNQGEDPVDIEILEGIDTVEVHDELEPEELQPAIDDAVDYEQRKADLRIIETVAYTLHQELYSPWLQIFSSSEKAKLAEPARKNLVEKYKRLVKRSNYGSSGPHSAEALETYIRKGLEEMVNQLAETRITPEAKQEFVRKRVNDPFAVKAIKQIIDTGMIVRGQRRYNVEQASKAILEEFFAPMYDHIVNDSTSIGRSNEQIIAGSERFTGFMMKSYEIMTKKEGSEKMSDHYDNGRISYNAVKEQPKKPVFGHYLDVEDITRILDLTKELPFEESVYLGAPEHHDASG